jgi:hypothetical protein
MIFFYPRRGCGGSNGSAPAADHNPKSDGGPRPDPRSFNIHGTGPRFGISTPSLSYPERLSIDDAGLRSGYSRHGSYRSGRALVGVPALGALVGSGVVMAMGNLRHEGKLIISVTLLYTVGLISFALSRSLTLSLVIVFLGLVDAIGETFARHFDPAHHAGPYARPGKEFRASFHVRRHLPGSPADGHCSDLLRNSRCANYRRIPWCDRGAISRQVRAESKKYRKLEKDSHKTWGVVRLKTRSEDNVKN